MNALSAEATANLPVGIYRADREGRCTHVNARWCEFTGMSAEEARGDGWLRAIHPQDRQRVLREWESAHRGGQPFHAEYRYQRPDASVRWILDQVAADRDARGEFAGYIGTVTDVTALHRLREDLLESQTDLETKVRERTQKLLHMSLVVEASDDAIITSDFEGNIRSWNKAAEAMFGWHAAEVLGQTTARLTPAHLWEEARAMKARARRGERIERFETERMKKNGELFDVSLSAFPLRDALGHIIGTSGIVRDLTERKKAEQHLRQLSWRLLQAQDEERRRIARELHDSTAQTVVALSMNLSRLRQGARLLPAAMRRALIEDSLALADTAARELRTTAYVLHPPLLDERGLGAALGWLVEGFTVRSGIAVTLEIAADVGRLPDAVELTIFRVAQESLANVHRHSKSPTASIHLARDGDSLALEIVDRGCGLPALEGRSPGVGISGMKERLLQLGGSLRIEAREPGTAVIARLPLAS